MAKKELTIQAELTAFITYLHNGILSGSVSASYEDGSDFVAGDVRVAIRVYERYSMIGDNRVSLQVTAVEHQGSIRVTIITSGGSQGMFMKFNTFGEESFLDKTMDLIRAYPQGRNA